jgi:hypothetical protein
MTDVCYRLFINNKPATCSQVKRIEEITVEQEEDKVWQAALVIPLCLDTGGRWSGEDDDFLSDFTRFRIEVRVNDKAFVPLIDGPLVWDNNQMKTDPGQSSIRIFVHDDSVYLNRINMVQKFEGMTDDKILRFLMRDFPEIATWDVDTTLPRREIDLSSLMVMSGTSMHIIKALVACRGIQVYVLPGQEPGKSIGMFKKPVTEVSNLAPLVLTGKGRNVASFSVHKNVQKPKKISASRLSFKTKNIVSATSKFSDSRLGDEMPFDDEKNLGTEELSPYRCPGLSPREGVDVYAQSTRYAIRAQGRVLSGFYPDVLRPYTVVYVQGVDGRNSGQYNITRVIHRLTRSEYTQDFSVRRDARSKGTGNAVPVTGSVHPAINPSGGIL